MGKLIYLMNVSLDGFIETRDQSLDWTVMDEELHAWFNEHMRTVDASLYGRRLYELMAEHWPTAEDDPSATDVELEFARLWMATPNIVFSSTLDRVEHNSRLVRGDIGTVLEEVRREFPGDLEVGGPTLALNSSSATSWTSTTSSFIPSFSAPASRSGPSSSRRITYGTPKRERLAPAPCCCATSGRDAGRDRRLNSRLRPGSRRLCTWISRGARLRAAPDTSGRWL